MSFSSNVTLKYQNLFTYVQIFETNICVISASYVINILFLVLNNLDFKCVVEKFLCIVHSIPGDLYPVVMSYCTAF